MCILLLIWKQRPDESLFLRPRLTMTHTHALCRFIIDSLSRPLGALHVCKGERVKQLREGCAAPARGASQQLDTMLSCQMQKKFYNYNRGECAQHVLRPSIYCVSLESGCENYGPPDFAICLRGANETRSPTHIYIFLCTHFVTHLFLYLFNVCVRLPVFLAWLWNFKRLWVNMHRDGWGWAKASERRGFVIMDFRNLHEMR